MEPAWPQGHKGSKGIRILAPMIGIRRKKDEEADKDIRKQNERKDWNDKEPQLLPAKHLAAWIQNNLYLSLADAPFDRDDATL